jgi:predicted nucleotidyltransferase
MREGWKISGGRPDRRQLAAALDGVVERYGPDRIVMFGSAARGEMTAGSDVDLLLVHDAEHVPAGSPGPQGTGGEGPPMDILEVTQELLAAHRDNGNRVYGVAVRDGLVLYDGGRRFAYGEKTAGETLPRENEDERMVRRFRYQARDATDWLLDAEEKLELARRSKGLSPKHEYENAQASAERALKAMIIAHGETIEGTHELGELAAALRRLGERLPAVAGVGVLERLSGYGKGGGYMGHHDPRETPADRAAYLPTASALYKLAARRVPEILRSRAPAGRDVDGKK